MDRRTSCGGLGRGPPLPSSYPIPSWGPNNTDSHFQLSSWQIREAFIHMCGTLQGSAGAPKTSSMVVVEINGKFRKGDLGMKGGRRGFTKLSPITADLHGPRFLPIKGEVFLYEV